MKILVVPSFYPEDTSPNKGAFFQDQVKALSKYVDRIDVAYVEQRTLREFNLLRLRDHFFQQNTIKQQYCDEYRIKGWKLPTIIGDYIWICITVKLVKAYIEANGRPDILHVHNAFSAGKVALIIKKKYNIPFIVTEHDSAFLMGKLSPKKKCLAGYIYKEAVGIISVSKSLREAMLLIDSGLEIEVIPNIINSLFFEGEPCKERKKISNGTNFIAVGALNSNKGHEMLLTAFSILISKNKDIRLKICGSGSENDRLQARIKELRLQDKIELLGFLSSQQIYDNFMRADCIVHASYFETFGVVLVEALATGMPFISTKSGGPEDIHEDCFGYLVEKGNAVLFAEAMQKYISEKDVFICSEIRRRTLQKYGENSICMRIIANYKNVLDTLK